MTKKIYTVLTLIICLFAVPCHAFAVGAEDERKSSEQLMCIAYRGDTALYEANSRQAVLSAFDKGADFVSVNVRKSDDGSLVLCSENAVEIKGILLEEMLSELDENQVLILDFDKELKDEVYSLLEENEAFSRAYLRIKDSAKNINKWLSSKSEKPRVIGVNSSFNIFTVKSFVKNMSAMPAIQLQSKNYFNVMYGSLCYDAYPSRQGTGIIAPMYNPDLCGQRSDSEDGWNDLIKKNFNIIETNNLDSFIAYKENALVLKEHLGNLLTKAQGIDAEGYSLVSRENLADAIEKADALMGGFASCDELQSAVSGLQLAINSLASSEGEDTQKGALNITPGKIIAALLVGSLILAAQIYVQKMQKEKKR